MTGTILTNRTAVDRNKTDFYETPPEVTKALLDFLEQRDFLVPGQSVIWEPACGGGKLSKVLEGRGYQTVSTDLYECGYGEAGVDFMSNTRPCDWIITNPPFSHAAEFISRAFDLGKPCAILVKSQFWHAKRRIELYRRNPPSYVLPLTWRPDFLYGAKSGSPTMEIIWIVWTGTHHAAKYVPLEKPE